MGDVIRISMRVASTETERAAAVERWLAARPEPARRAARVVIAEGLLFDRSGPQDVPVIGLGAGCPCCVGLLPLRVLLARTLRRYRPSELLLLLRATEHLPHLRRLLAGGELGVPFEVDA